MKSPASVYDVRWISTPLPSAYSQGGEQGWISEDVIEVFRRLPFNSMDTRLVASYLGTLRGLPLEEVDRARGHHGTTLDPIGVVGAIAAFKEAHPDFRSELTDGNLEQRIVDEAQRLQAEATSGASVPLPAGVLL